MGNTIQAKQVVVFKPNKYNYALTEYLTTELKKNNIKCKNNISHISIKLKNEANEKQKLIIDCFNGNVYLRSENNKDVRVLRLARFGGQRESDAMHCAIGGCKQIVKLLSRINRTRELVAQNYYADEIVDDRNRFEIVDMRKKNIEVIDMRKNINDSDDENLENIIKNSNTNSKQGNQILGWLKELRLFRKIAAKLMSETQYEVIDMRKNRNNQSNSDFKVIDMRRKKQLKIQCSSYGRERAIAIVDGNIFEGDTHGEAITEFLKYNGIEDLEFFDRYELKETLGNNFYSQFAAAHLYDDHIELDLETLENISINQCINLLNNEYNYKEILDYDTGKKIS